MIPNPYERIAELEKEVERLKGEKDGIEQELANVQNKFEFSQMQWCPHCGRSFDPKEDYPNL